MAKLLGKTTYRASQRTPTTQLISKQKMENTLSAILIGSAMSVAAR